MRYLCFFLLAFLTTSVASQPTKSLLSGPIFIEDTTSIVEEFNLDLTFLPQDLSYISESGSIFDAPRNSPGIAMLSSAIIPGSGQAINGKWGRAAAYFLAEAVSLAYYFNQNAQAKDNERAYEAYADQNWSVLAYAQWLVAYSEANGLTNGYEALQSELALLSPGDQNPNFGNTSDDWRKVNLTTLRNVEVETRFVFDNPAGCGSNDPPNCQIKSEFSHVVQDYGSQQYYELMSKYYQFQPGWQDFHTQRLSDGNGHIYQYTWNRDMITGNFIEGRDRAYEFNENYRQAGNILKFLVVNHVISAFDAFFTVKLKNSRLETQANLVVEESVSLIWHF
jgi:hypothetical protein